jgi:TFIIF-interacting CTD phosphatase-like protein
MESTIRIIAVLSCILISVPGAGCSGSTESVPDKIASSGENSKLIQKIGDFSSPRFTVQEIIDEDQAVRVNIVFLQGPKDLLELKRLTLNALFEVQSVVGKTSRLSVWSWDAKMKKFSGYAFYSPVDNSYHFKVPGEDN